MKTIVIFLGIVFGAVLVLAIGGGLLALLAYGIGRLLNLVMGLESFQATALSLAGIFVFIILAERVFKAFTPLAPGDFDDDDEFDDEFDGEYDEEFDDDDSAENMEALNKLYAGIPRWRRPTKNLDFSKAKPDDRCPCGSGRKYKNCHGSKQTKI